MNGQVGRPRIEIDPEELTRLCRLNCTLQEIAAYFNCSERTIKNRMADDEDFRAIVENGRANGRLSVRREQFRIMEGGNASMAIWLGKQLLGQRDNQEVINEHKPITIEVISPYEADRGDDQPD